MHQLNEMLTIIPSNSVTSEVTSPTSPALMNSLQSGQFSALTFGGYPGTGAGYLQNLLNGISLNALPAALGGYVLAGLPGTCRLAANGTTYSNVNGLNVISSTSCAVPGCVTGHLGGLAINGIALAPPTALTSSEVYGLPLATKSVTSSDSSSSGQTSPAPLSPAQSMELVWHGEFDRLFSQYFPHMWCLVPTFYPPGDTWRVFKDSAKVRFSCQECGHGWTSMKGRVIFWFELNYATSAGCVMFKLYGQQCQKCKTGKFEHAMWYPEEVVKVIGNVYNRVGQIYYGFVRPPLRIDRRIGKPRNQHNAELCQACKEGLCKEEWSFS